MAISKRHRILIATDGSPSAQAALATAVKFPWSASARARAVVARPDWLTGSSADARAVLVSIAEAAADPVGAADSARRALTPRWGKAEVVSLDERPVDAILAEARRFNASVIVVGWRGHGTFQRLLAGSVSRTVAAQAKCPVLVVREAPRAVRRVVLGFDGCPNAKRALDFLCSLEPKPGSRVVLVNVVEPVSVPASVARLPASLRGHIRHQASALNEERHRKAQETVEAAIPRLIRHGWAVKGEVRVGAPLANVLGAADDHRADVLVLGARATSGIERALLGSVANGAMNRSSVPVLLVR